MSLNELRHPWSRLGILLVVLACRLALPSSAGADEPKTKRASIYDAKADAKVQVEQAVAKARHDGTRVLLMFGGDWCGWCHKLHTLFREDREIATMLANEYQLVMIDTRAPNADALLKEASGGHGGAGYPFLAVLDSDTKVLVGQPTGPLEEGDHHDPKKVKDFLAKWQTPPKDAERLLSETLSQAESGDKRIFLTFGAPWCGWCHKLEDFLARPDIAELLKHDFIVLKIDVDRMKNGKEVMDRYRPRASQGVPWYVVLDAKGEKHGTADAAFGNIGYPFEAKEIVAFAGLLKSQGKLKPDQIVAMRQGLEKAADDIRAERARREASK